MLKSIESSALGTLKHTCKQAPWLVEFIETRLGVDYAGIGILLGEVGSPATRPNPGKLLAYCGHGDPERSRLTKDAVRRGVDKDGKTVTILPFSPAAKTLIWVVAESPYRQGHYRPV